MNINTLNECPKKAYFSTLNLNSKKSIYSYYREVIDEILGQLDPFSVMQNRMVVDSMLTESVPEDAFSMHTERKINLANLTDRIVRMGEFFHYNGFRFVKKGTRYAVNRCNKNLTGSYDLEVEQNGVIYDVKIAYGKVDGSASRSAKSYIGHDLGLYVQYLSTGNVPAIYNLLGNEKVYEPVRQYSVKDLTSKACKNRFFLACDYQNNPVSDIESRLNHVLCEKIDKHAKECTSACSFCWYNDLCQIHSNDIVSLTDVTTCERPSVIEKIKWTRAQQELIDTRSGETRVYAVAGSGKTSCLAATAIALRNDGISPSEITLCTFTVKGVQEIKEKIDKQLLSTGSKWKADDFHILSLNGLGYEIVQYWAKMNGNPIPTLIDDNEMLDIIAKVADEHPMIDGLDYARPFFRMFRGAGAVHKINELYIQIKNTGLANHELTATDIMTISQKSDKISKIIGHSIDNDLFTCQTIADVINGISAEMNREHKLTYDDQIHQAAMLLKSHAELRMHFEQICRYLIVDEFQDTGEDQMEMIKELYRPSSSSALIVVGDDAQAIMSFRGVDAKNINMFTNAYPNARTIHMNNNFRSTAEICNIGSNILSHNGLDVVLKTEHHGSAVASVKCKDRKEECDRAFEQVLDWLRDGIAMSDIAVLAKTRGELLEIRERLSEEGIPTVVAVSEYLKDDNAVIAGAHLCSFLRNRSNLMDLAIWLRRSEQTEYDSAIDTSSYLALKAAIINQETDTLNQEELYTYVIDQMHQHFNLKMTNALQTFFEKQEQIQNHTFHQLNSLFSTIVDGSSMISAGKDDTTSDAVTLSTIHSAKGREWKNVAVCTFGFSQNKSYDPEEIRTLFVAVTRAREELTVFGDDYWLTTLKKRGLI